jgi:ABC-type nitrate/sulfonate/bicarbonate transport system permease component
VLVPRAKRIQALRNIEQYLWKSSGAVLLLLGWEIGARTGVLPERYTSRPSTVFETGINLLYSGDLLGDIAVTGFELAVGMSVAIAIGIPIGLVAGWNRRIRYLIDPYLSALYATPALGLLPLLVLWFGIGIRSTTALVVISAIFPIVINVMYGVRTVDVRLVRMARSFGAGQVRILQHIVFPSTVPYLVSGLQVGLARGLIGVVIGEMYAARDGGLGYMIAVAGASIDVNQMFVAVVLVTAAGMIMIGAIRTLEQRLQRWKPKAVPQ